MTTQSANSMFAAELLDPGFFPLIGMPDPAESAFEIGLWMSGLESFQARQNRLFVETFNKDEVERDWTKEFRLTHSALQFCSKLSFRLRKALAVQGTEETVVSIEDVDDLAGELRYLITLNDNFLSSAAVNFEEWKTWSQLLSEKLSSSHSIQKYIVYCETRTSGILPENINKLLSEKPMSFADRADLTLILTGFARVLKSLSIVSRMLRNDEPLKHSLLIFSLVYDQTRGIIDHINNRLARFPNEEAELFKSLDAASYTASLELKKVYQQELTGLIGIRSAPSIYARIETAYALLNDSFQQIIGVFARLIEPDVDIFDLFPNFQVKLEQSIALRRHLLIVLQSVKEVEKDADATSVAELKVNLAEFFGGPIRFLFFKDKETLERFSEEIVATDERKDLVPILHRFGAYLETLLGQVNMRNVLVNHPLEKI